MTQYQPEERARLKRHWTEQAIALATSGKWDEAITANQNLILLAPGDVDAHNRLGKAYMELGRYHDARDAYAEALRHDPSNGIAQKNLQRLSLLQDSDTTAKPLSSTERVDPRLFIEETGKTVVTTLVNVAPKEVLARMTAGDQVRLRQAGHAIRVENGRGEALGELEAKLTGRLITFMEGGNSYAAAITALDDKGGVKIIIREVSQSPAMAGRVSFPPKGTEPTFRPYIKETVLRYNRDEDEEISEEGEYLNEGDIESEDLIENDFYEEEPSDIE